MIFRMNIMFTDNPDTADIRSILAAHNSVVIRESNTVWTVEVDEASIEFLMDTLDASPSVKFTGIDHPVANCTAAYVPTEPFYASGQTGMEIINAPKGWGITKGSPSVKVAILDSGLDTYHPDFTGQLADGHSVVGGNYYPDAGFHGTLVSGVLANEAGSGIIGLASGCKLTPIKITNSSTGANSSDIQAGVAWVVSQGLSKIISISYGGSNIGPTSVTYVSPTQFTIAGNAVSTMLNVRFHIIDGGVPRFGTITEAVYTTLTTCTIVWDEEFAGVFSQLYLHDMFWENATTDAWNAGCLVFVAAGNDQTLVTNGIFGTHVILVANANASGGLMGGGAGQGSNYGPNVPIASITDSKMLSTYLTGLTGIYKFTKTVATVNGSSIATLSAQYNNITTDMFYHPVEGTPFQSGTLIMPVVEADKITLHLSKPATATGSYTATFWYQAYHMWASGTSSTCPAVAALAGLIKSVDPALTNAEIKDCILSTKQPLPNAPAGAAGVGLIDVYNAMHKAKAKTVLIDTDLELYNKTVDGGKLWVTPIQWAEAYRVYVEGNRWPDADTEFTEAPITLAGLPPGQYTVAVSAVAQGVESAQSPAINISISAENAQDHQGNTMSARTDSQGSPMAAPTDYQGNPL